MPGLLWHGFGIKPCYQAIVVATCVTMMSFPGCGRRTQKSIETYPVSGAIFVNGKPPVRAEIRLKPKVPLQDPLKRSIEPYAIVEEDGSFHVSTYDDADGAPAGQYAVTVVWPLITVDGGEETIGPDRLGRKFADPNQPVTTIEVVEDENEIPAIQLKL